LRVDSADSNAVRVLVGWNGTMPITASVSPAFIEPIPRPMTPDECACRHYIAEGLAAVEAARGAK